MCKIIVMTSLADSSLVYVHDVCYRITHSLKLHIMFCGSNQLSFSCREAPTRPRCFLIPLYHSPCPHIQFVSIQSSSSGLHSSSNQLSFSCLEAHQVKMFSYSMMLLAMSTLGVCIQSSSSALVRILLLHVGLCFRILLLPSGLLLCTILPQRKVGISVIFPFNLQALLISLLRGTTLEYLLVRNTSDLHCNGTGKLSMFSMIAFINFLS